MAFHDQQSVAWRLGEQTKKYSTANLRLTTGMDRLRRRLSACTHRRLGCWCFQLWDSGIIRSMTKYSLKPLSKSVSDRTLLNNSEIYFFRCPKFCIGHDKRPCGPQNRSNLGEFLLLGSAKILKDALGDNDVEPVVVERNRVLD